MSSRSRENLLPTRGTSPPKDTSPPSKDSRHRRTSRPASSGPTRERSSAETVIHNVTQLEERQGSLPLAQLKGAETEFFEIIEDGNVAAVERFLKDHPSLNVNCVNYMGQSALNIAIKKENEDMIKFLFRRPDLEIRDAALHAVATGNVDLTRTILEAISNVSPFLEMRGCEDSPDYPPDITPFMVAAQNGDYKMVRMFLERGHQIEKPHAPNCLCQKCKAILREAGSSQSRIRLNAYRAICNPSYICQVTDDPILYGFLLDEELKECAIMDKEFRAEYGELGEGVRQFTVTFLSHCRNTAETETLLKLPWGFDIEHINVTFPRLQLAIDYHQKEFVAHSMVQQVLTSHWLGEFRSWPRLSLGLKILHVLLRMIFLPFICFALIVVPFLKPLKKYRSPLNRFLMSLASFMLFVLFVLLLNLKDTGKYQRGPPRTGFEALIVLYVLGFIWATLRQFLIKGARRFFRVIWNWYDVAMEFTFMITFILWLKASADVRLDHIHKREPQQRKFWPGHDATLLHEGFFSIATVLTFGKLTYYCLQSSRLGPFQVSLGKMSIQIGYFLCLCLLINTSFAVPLTRMYAYYNGMTQTNQKGETRTQLSSFSTFSNSFSTLFWGMFGMSPVESTDVVIENLTEDKKNPVLNQHGFTEGVGLTLFATYELMMVIALVNTLIAVLSNTFQRIIDNADTEFKFARTKLWMHFLDDSTALPSPFNLFPTMNAFIFCVNYSKALTNQIPGAKAKFSFRRCFYIEYKSETEVDEHGYQSLMSNIVQRYFRAKEQENSE